MRNSGIFHILSRVVSQKGLRGFMAGWKIHLLLFPMVMVNMILANIMFIQLKKLFFPRRLHKGPRGNHPPTGPLYGLNGEMRNNNGANIGSPVQPNSTVAQTGVANNNNNNNTNTNTNANTNTTVERTDSEGENNKANTAAE